MWAILSVVLLVALFAAYVTSQMKKESVNALVDANMSIEQQVAMIGAQVAKQCITKPAGVYSQAALLGSSLSQTPVGNNFVCIAKGGGTLATGNVIAVVFEQPPKFIPGKDASGDATQLAFAFGVAKTLKEQSVGTPDVMSGIIRKGSAKPTLEVNEAYSVDLNGLLAPNFPHHTPAIVAGLIDSTW